MRFLKTLELVLQCLGQLAEIWDWLQTHKLIFDVFSLGSSQKTENKAR